MLQGQVKVDSLAGNEEARPRLTETRELWGEGAGSTEDFSPQSFLSTVSGKRDEWKALHHQTGMFRSTDVLVTFFFFETALCGDFY